MSQPYTDEGVITKLERLQYSNNGIPSYRITLDNGNVYQTETDSMINLEIENPALRGCTVRLLIEAGRVWDISVI